MNEEVKFTTEEIKLVNAMCNDNCLVKQRYITEANIFNHLPSVMFALGRTYDNLSSENTLLACSIHSKINVIFNESICN